MPIITEPSWENELSDTGANRLSATGCCIGTKADGFDGIAGGVGAVAIAPAEDGRTILGSCDAWAGGVRDAGGGGGGGKGRLGFGGMGGTSYKSFFVSVNPWNGLSINVLRLWRPVLLLAAAAADEVLGRMSGYFAEMDSSVGVRGASSEGLRSGGAIGIVSGKALLSGREDDESSQFPKMPCTAGLCC